MIKIHNFARGARGVRVFWLCEEMGLPYQVEAMPFPIPDSYRALHPLATVPFLEDEGGVAMSESVAMLLYLAQRYGPTPLLPTEDAARLARVLQMAVFAEATLGARMNALRPTSAPRKPTSATGRCEAWKRGSRPPWAMSRTCSTPRGPTWPARSSAWPTSPS